RSHPSSPIRKFNHGANAGAFCDHSRGLLRLATERRSDYCENHAGDRAGIIRLMLSQLPTGAVNSTGVIDTRRDAICISGSFAPDLCVIGFGLANLSFTASFLKNCYVPSKFLLTGAKLARRSG